jgi:hypothetical protein
MGEEREAGGKEHSNMHHVVDLNVIYGIYIYIFIFVYIYFFVRVIYILHIYVNIICGVGPPTNVYIMFHRRLYVVCLQAGQDCEQVSMELEQEREDLKRQPTA